MSEPFWLSAFLDLPADRHAAGAAYWQRVTGFELSAPRGPHEEFATLLPPDGDDHLRVQRVGDGAPRLHLDLHVEDPRATAGEAVGLGARLVADEGDFLTLTSPGGLIFCLVSHPAVTRPQPTQWPDGHLAHVDQVCLDIPPSAYDAEVDFWHRLTGWERRDPEPGSEFGRLTPPPTYALQLLLQRLDDEQDAVTAHLDWSSTDHAAEVARHVDAGAEEVATFDWWTVLRDPTGLTYCVTRRSPSGVRTSPPYAGDEIATLTGFLEWHRATLRTKAGGLDSEQLQRTLAPSDLTLGGMVKHLTFVEDWWFGRNLIGIQAEPWSSVDWHADGDWDWHSAADDTPEQLWAAWEQAVARSRVAVAADPDPERLAVKPHPWSKQPFSLRWLLVHMIEEYARHLGHADLIRQSIDGSVGD